MSRRLRAALFGTTALVFAAASQARAADAVDVAPNEVSGVVVTAPREEAVARQRQYDAPNLVNIQSAETIEKYPDFNAAEALSRIPGVTISTDTGEGRFVNIRGIDGNLLGATFGGVPLLNTNPGGTNFGSGGRAVEYDTIPTGSIDGIVVSKTTLPDHEAEGLGGSIDMTPRTAAHITHPFFEGALGWDYEPAHSHTGPFNIEAAVGDRIAAGGFSNPAPFSFVLTASRRDDRRGFDDIEEDYIDPSATRAYDDLQLRHYDYHRRRFGYGGEFDFQPNDDHGWYVRANVAGYKEAVKKNFLVYNNLGDDSRPNGQSLTTLPVVSSTDEEETHRNQVYVVGGQDRFGETLLDYRASYSRATFSVDKNFGVRFNGPAALPISYDNSANNGDRPTLVVDNSIVNNPANYAAARRVTDSTEDDRDSEWAYAANLLFPVHFLNEGDRIKLGVEARLRDKASTPSRFASATAPLSLASASGPPDTDFYGRYTNGPNIDTQAVRNAYFAGTITGGVNQGGVFTAKEDIYAGYAQYQATVGKWGLLAGVRVENTKGAYGAFSDDNSAQAAAFVTRSNSYTNAFPTVQLRYEVSPQFLIRATYSTGISRPGFNQVTAATSSNHDPSDPQISNGNPNLKPTTGNMFDLSAEYYLPHGGIIQVGLFDKEFDNYIVTQFQRRRYTGTDPAFQGLIVGFTTFDNRSNAWARGIEAAYHQTFDWLPDPWSGLGIDANVTLVDSKILEYDAATSASGKDETGLLPGTSRLTFNVAPFYEAHGLQLRLAGQYASKELFHLGGSKAADTTQDSRFTLDFTSSYRISSTWTAYFNVRNLTNAPLRFYLFNSSFPIQREYYDQSYEAGVRARF